jgi:hypothetical protein
MAPIALVAIRTKAAAFPALCQIWLRTRPSLQPDHVIDALLKGLPASGNQGSMPSFAAMLSDQDVADISNYVRINLGNRSPTGATSALVASLRTAVAANQIGIKEAKDESSPAFECPAIGMDGVKNILVDWKDVGFPLDAYDILTVNKIDKIILRVRNDHPGVAFPSLVNSLTAGYCSIVARQPDRTEAQKRAQLARFDKLLEQQIVAMSSATGDQILVSVPLSQIVMQAVTNAAAGEQETATNWMSKAIGRAALGQN